MIKHAKQESGLACSGPQGCGSDSRQGKKASEPIFVAGEEGQRRDRELGGGLLLVHLLAGAAVARLFHDRLPERIWVAPAVGALVVSALLATTLPAQTQTTIGDLLTQHGVAAPLALLAALGLGAAIGLIHGIIFAKIGIPAFVVTLA